MMAWKNLKSSSWLNFLMVTCSSIISVEKTFQFLWSSAVMNGSVWNSCIFNIGLFQSHKGCCFPHLNYHFQLLVVSLIGPMSEFAFFHSVKRCLCQSCQRLVVLDLSMTFWDTVSIFVIF